MIIQNNDQYKSLTWKNCADIIFLLIIIFQPCVLFSLTPRVALIWICYFPVDIFILSPFCNYDGVMIRKEKNTQLTITQRLIWAQTVMS